MNRLRWSFVVVVVLLVALLAVSFARADVTTSAYGRGWYRARAAVGPMPLRVVIRCDEGGIVKLELVRIQPGGRAVFRCVGNEQGGFTP